MGAVEALRVAGVAAAVAFAATPARAHADEPVPAATAPVAAGEPIAIVDARNGDAPAHADERAALAESLRRDGLAPIEGALARALAGVDDTTDGALADAALAATRERFGALDCAGVRAQGQQAVQLLAGREAAGVDERARLQAAYTYLLLCADRDGARVAAQGFADRLRALGGSPAIPADVWARFPEIDAGSEYAHASVELADGRGGSVAGAEVWLDHRRVGRAPTTLRVATGEHVLALARGAERAAVNLQVTEPKPLTLSIALTSFAAAGGDVATQVRRWQAGAPVRPAEVAALLARAGARFAIVVEGDGHASLWAQASASEPADVIAEAELARPAALVDAARARLAAWARGPAVDVPLISGHDLDGAEAAPTRRRAAPWWVYVAIGGAAVAGGVTIWALDAGENRQRIELTFP